LVGGASGRGHVLGTIALLLPGGKPGHPGQDEEQRQQPGGARSQPGHHSLLSVRDGPFRRAAVATTLPDPAPHLPERIRPGAATTSFPASAWERTAGQALPAFGLWLRRPVSSGVRGGASLAVRSQAEPGNEGGMLDVVPAFPHDTSHGALRRRPP